MSEQYALEVGEPTPGHIHLKVSGEVDVESAPLLLESILGASLACGPGHRVVVDLEEVSFIDSSGLATLVDANQRLRAQEQTFALSHVSDRVRRLISLTGLDQVIDFEPAAEHSRAS